MKHQMPNEIRDLVSFAGLPDRRLELACNENAISDVARGFLGSAAASRYYFGSNNGSLSDYPLFAAPGYPNVDAVLDDAKRALMKSTGATYVNLAPLSGIHAMIMTIVGLSEPGDTILSLDPLANGHFATKDVIESLGRKSAYVPRTPDGQIDTDRLVRLVDKTGASMVYLDLATHLEPISAQAAKAALGNRVVMVCDASHSLGLVMGGEFQDPFADGFDVVCANTHKTFPGPHRGIILARDVPTGARISEAVDSKLYSSVHFGSLLAMAVSIFEMRDFGREYAQAVVANAAKLTVSLAGEGFVMGERGNPQLPGNQQVHMTYKTREEAHDVLRALLRNRIVAHLCLVEREGFIVRFGTQEVTRLGMNEPQMEEIAAIVKQAADGRDVRKEVDALALKYQTVKYSYDVPAAKESR